MLSLIPVDPQLIVDQSETRRGYVTLVESPPHVSARNPREWKRRALKRWEKIEAAAQTDAQKAKLALRRERFLELVRVVTEPANDVDRSRVGAVAAWLDHLYATCLDEDPDVAIDLVLSTVDDLLHERNAEDCDQILAATDVTRLSVEAMLALLMETARASRALPSREAFFRCVEAELQRKGEREANALLADLL